MPLVPHEERANYRISGSDFEPKDPAFRAASSALKRKYWKRLGELAIEAHRKQMRLSQDRFGAKLTPVKYRRPDGADGPPLVPHRADSRTWKLLAAVETENGVTVFWRGHGRKSWSEVVKFHAEGKGRYGPIAVRDEIGLAPAGQKWVKARAAAFWESIAPKPRAKAAARPAASRPSKAPPPRVGLSKEAAAIATRYPSLRPFLSPPRPPRR